MANSELEWIYDYIVQIIKSPEFRNPIKDFIDDYCDSFIGVDENTFEQGDLHRRFQNLVDTLLETMTKDIGITEEMFCLAAKKGLGEEKDKKYFEQLISFTNYNYFKNLMTKRNLQLEALAYKQMIESGGKKNKEQEADPMNAEEIKELEEKEKEAEKKQLDAAIQMSLAAEEEKKKLKDIEDAELEKAIKLSLMDLGSAKPEEVKPIMKAIPKDVAPTNPVPAPKPEPTPVVEIPKENKMNPVDKVALKQKMLKEHDEKLKFSVNQKLAPLPNFTPTFKNEGDSAMNKKLNEIEESKAQKLKEYREMIIKMKKEKREKEEKEEDILNPTEEDKKRIDLRKQLADKLKAKLSLKK